MSILAIGVIGGTPITRVKFGIPLTEFKLFSADGSTVIGRARFEIAERTTQEELVQGKYQFTSGEYDTDEDWVQLGRSTNDGALMKYKHSFFHPDGSLERVNEADMVSGLASCSRYLHGRSETQNAKLSFPSDTYAGPVIILPIREFIRSGLQGTGEFHYFSCAPNPKIYPVKIVVQRHVHWSFYSGELEQVDLQPDFGLLGLLISPLVPKIRLWFDAASDLALVGAKSYRYYKGLEFIMVRSPIAR